MSAYSAVLDRLDLGLRGTPSLWSARVAAPTQVRSGLVLTDLTMVAISVTVVTKWFIPGLPAFRNMLIGLVAALFLTAVIGLRGGYRRAAMRPGAQGVGALVRGLVVSGGTAMSLAYLGVVAAPPTLLASAVGTSAVLAFGARGLLHVVLRARMRTGAAVQRVLLVGPAHRCSALARILTRHDPHGTAVLGRCAVGEQAGTSEALGGTDQARELVERLGVDVVIVASGALSAQELQELGWRLEGLEVSLLVAPDVTDVASHRTQLVTVGGTPMVRVALGASRASTVLKAVIDRVVGVLVALCALVVLVPAMVAVKVTSPGPVFFRQTRVGEDGVPFTMLKLRTMYVDAEERLAEFAEQSDGNGVLFKMRNDPRVTSLGRILRRFSIDELPQVWNVIRGEMSLVGPRPPLPREVAEYDDRAYHRLLAKPGLTGLWQVSGRSDLDWEESVRLDLYYVDNRCTQDDLRILARTAGAVLGGRGAY